MYTIKVKFKTGFNTSKVYEYASMNSFNKSNELEVLTHEGYKAVVVVDCIKGITNKATKWRSGSAVTASQRQQYRINNTIRKDKMVEVIKLFQQFQGQLEGKFDIGINVAGKFYFTPCGTYGRVVDGTKGGAIDELYDLLEKDAKQLEIERKVDELKAQIAELEEQLG